MNAVATPFAPWRRVGGALCLPASLALLALGQARFAQDAASAGIRLFLAGIALAATGAILLAEPPEVGPSRPAPAPLEAWEWAFLAVSTFAAAAIRLPFLDRFPPGGFFDECQNVLVACGILKGELPVFVGEASQMPALYFYPVAASVALFGRNVESVRLVSALAGTAAIPVFYLLARRFFAREVAAAAALLLVGSRWHLNFSRIGFNGILSPLVELLSLLALAKAFESRRALHWALFGASVGIGLQTYYAFNLFPAVLAAAVAAYLFRGGLRSFREDLVPLARGIGLAIAVAVVLLLPLVVFAVRHPETFFQRAGTVAIWNPAHGLEMPRALYENIRTHLLMFGYHGDGNPRHNIQDEPLLTSIESVLLAFGLGCTLGRGLRWPRPAWLAWFVVMLLPGILTIEAPQAYRTVGVIPGLYLLIAEGMQTLVRAAAGRPRPSPLLGGALGALAATTAAWGSVVFFALQVHDPRAFAAFEAEHHAVARFLAAEAGGHDVFLDSRFFDVPAVRVALGNDFPSARLRLSDHFPVPDPALYGPRQEKPLLFILDGSRADLVPVFRSVFPRAVVGRHPDPFGGLFFVSIEVSLAERRQAREACANGWLASFYEGEDWDGTPKIVRREAALLFHFHWDQEALSDPFSADYAARLRVDEPGEHQFELLATGPALVLVDGERVIEQTGFESMDTLAGVATLEAGEHLLVVRHVERSYASALRFWWRPPCGRRSLIPLGNLTALSPTEYESLRDSLPRPERRP